MSKHASLNRSYKLVWSDRTQSWVVVSELTRGKSKSSTSLLSTLLSVLALNGAAIGGALMGTAALAADLPTGGQVTAGQASISQSGNSMTINQTTPKDWSDMLEQVRHALWRTLTA